MDFTLFPRDLVGDIKGAPQTFSSWDKCMQKAYCKWPAIVGIVVASLIVLSLLMCIVQCLCCGVSLASACCNCLTCGCRGCGNGSRSRGSRYKDDYTRMPVTPSMGYQPASAPMSYAGPQTATFDASTNKVHADSLPPMPSWETAATRRVEDHTQDLEMGRLQPPVRKPVQSRGGYSQVPRGPTSPTPGGIHDHSEGYFMGTDSAYARQSDLGMQRIGSYQDQHQHEYRSSTVSPAPTYHTNPPSLINDGQHFGNQRVSPPPAGTNPYDQHQAYPPRSSVGYQMPEPATRGAEMPYHHGVPEFHSGEQRPPSLLQVGRKAVPGSVREV